MGLTWHPAAIPGLIALATGVSMAAVVYWTRPDGSQNRRLALLLAVEGIGFGALGAMSMATTVPTSAGLESIVLIQMLLLPWLYLGFLATLDAPLVRWLDNRTATVSIAVLAGLAASSYFLFRPLFIQGFAGEARFGGYEWIPGPLVFYAFLGLLIAALFGLAAALSLYRNTPHRSARRSTARAYLAAFGVRDTLQVASLLFILSPAPDESTVFGFFMGNWLPQISSVLFSLLLAYGILKAQLFEIDLKLKWTLEKGTVAAIFVAVFFIVSEGAQVLFAGFAQSEFLGILAAGALLFLLSPLQRFAARLGDAAMPGVEDTETYRQGRKEEIYRAQLEELMADEQITKKERRALHRLQDDLGLDGETANRLEREVLGATGGEA